DAESAGQIFVAAAGNSGTNADITPLYPAAYPLSDIVSVAATDRDDAKASFSNYGATTVDLGAPRVSVLSTTRNNTYRTFSGTSMATPHVAGVLALVTALHPSWTYSQVISHVLMAVDPNAALSDRTVTGGRLNAAAALAAVPDSPGSGNDIHLNSVT